ncbi:MAG: GNAT family N-acetyltransferase [Pyrobaculum sp.]
MDFLIDYVEITGVYSKIVEFYKKVTLESIIYRFLHPVGDITYMYKYLWGRGCRSFLIYLDNKPVGTLDITPCGEGVEVAILIADQYQGRGVGTYVAFDFARRLKKLGFRYAVAYVSPENYKALSIARRVGARISCKDLCVIRYDLDGGGGCSKVYIEG